MSIICLRTTDCLTLVHSSDPDVIVKDDAHGWLPVTDSRVIAGVTATRVTIRPLNGLEALGALAEGIDEQKTPESRADARVRKLAATLRKAVVQVDGEPVNLDALFALSANVLLDLERAIAELSDGPTAARA